MNLDAEWLLLDLQPVAGVVAKMTLDGAAQADIDTYLEQVGYAERLNAYKLARAAS